MAQRERVFAPEGALLRAALAGDDLALIEQRARSILERWPEKETARAAMRHVRQSRFESERVALETAVAAALHDRALTPARAALATLRQIDVAAAEAWMPRVTTLEQELRAARESDALARVRSLATSDLDAALSAFAGLEEALRARVLASVDRATFAPLEQLLRRVDPEAALAAMRALRAASAALDGGDEATAARNAAPCEALLRHCAAGRDLLAKLRETAERARRRAAREALDALVMEHAALPSDTVARLVESIDRDALDSADSARLVAIVAEIESRSSRDRLGALVAQRESAGDLLAARASVRSLVKQTEAAERQHWQAAEKSLTARIDAAWHHRVIPGIGQPGELAHVNVGMSIHQSATRALSDDGETLVLVEGFEHWLCIRIVETATSCVSRRITLRTPEPQHALDWVVDGNTLLILTERGGFLEYDLDACELVRWRFLGKLAGTHFVDFTFLPPGGRWAWFDLRDARRLVIDVDAVRVIRTTESAAYVATTLGDPEAPATELRNPGGARSLSANGAAADRPPLPSTVRICAVAAYPGVSQARVACVEFDDGDDEPCVRLIAVDRAGRVHEGPVLDDTGPDFIQGFVPEHPTAQIHLIYGTSDGFRIRSFRMVPDPFVEVLSISMDERPCLVADLRCARVRMMYPTARGFSFAAIGDATPGLVDRLRLASGDLDDVPSCAATQSCPSVARERADAVFRGATSPDEYVARARSFLEDPTPASPECTGLVLSRISSLIGKGRLDLALARRAFEASPANDLLTMCFAECLMAVAGWTEVERLLAPVADRVTDTRIASHMQHLRGIAAMRRGEEPLARSLLKRAAANEPGCDVTTLRGLAGDPDVSPSGYTLLRDAIIAADARLVRGDPKSARELLDNPLVASCNELQALARRASIWLDEPADDPGELGTKIAACMQFVAACVGGSLFSDGLPLGAAKWDRARIDALAERARAWLLVETGPRKHIPRPW